MTKTTKESQVKKDRKSGEAMANVQVKGRAIRVAAPGEESMGDLFWYSVPYKLEVEENVMHEKGAEFQIKDEWLPGAVRGTNAFKRATDGLKSDAVVAHTQGIATRETVLVLESPNVTRGQQKAERKSKGKKAKGEVPVEGAKIESGDEKKVIRRFIVRQVLVGMAKPVFHDIGHVDYQEGAGIKGSCESSDAAEIQKFEDMVMRVAQRYKHFLSHYIDIDIRNIILRVERELKTIPVRSSGSIYFAPIEAREQLANLSRFGVAIGLPEFKVVPAAGIYTPEEIAQHLTNAVDAETSKVQKEYLAAKKAGTISKAKFQELQRKALAATELYEHYRKSMKLDLAAAGLKLEGARNQFSALASLVGARPAKASEGDDE